MQPRSFSTFITALLVMSSLLLAGLPKLLAASASLSRPQQQVTEPVYALQGTLSKAARQHFDTYMVTSDRRAYALIGETPDIEAQLVALRDQTPQVLVKVWGTLYPQGRSSATPEIVVTSVVAVEESPTSAQPLPTGQPLATVRNASINLRSGPGTEYTAVVVLQQGQACTIVGRNGENNWWQITCPDNSHGWVLGQLVDVTGNTSPVPVVAVAAPPPPPPPPPPTVFYGWKTAWWRNRDLAGEPVSIADLPEAVWDWKEGPPEQPDNFSTRWERTINFAPGTYRFSARADDGVRVFIDNQLIIDQWHISAGNTTYTADRAMYGNQSVRIEHFEGDGLANLAFAFSQLSSSTMDGGGSGDWEANYFTNPDLAGAPVLVRREARSSYPIDRDWGYSSPAPGIIPDDNWSVRWRGRYFFEAGDFVFQARSDDGVRVYIDGIRVIDAWSDGYKEPANRFLAVGRGEHEIMVEFYERGGTAFQRVWWYRLSPDDYWRGRDD